MEFFQLYVEVSDRVWDEVAKWTPIARDTVGKQLIRAMDAVGANLVEGDGRYTDADALHFFVIARASAREARYWLIRAATRGLLPAELSQARIEQIVKATKLLNLLISYRRTHRRRDRISDAVAPYLASDNPFAEPTDE